LIYLIYFINIQNAINSLGLGKGIDKITLFDITLLP